jgi:hypothetical protein
MYMHRVLTHRNRAREEPESTRQYENALISIAGEIVRDGRGFVGTVESAASSSKKIDWLKAP